MKLLARLGAVVPLALLAAAAYELALALGASGVGPEPDEGVRGEDVVAVLAFVAMLVAALVSLTGRRWAGTLTPLAAPAAAAFVLARFYTYDPYYAPTERRYSDGGAVPAAWIWGVAAAAVVVGVAARRSAVARVLAGAVIFVCLLTAVFAGDGH